MRYSLGDILQVSTKPCDCGMPGLRFRIIGRADDMLIIKGVNVYPEAVKTIVFKFRPKVTGFFRILLSKPGPLVEPPLNIQVEYDKSVLEADLPALEQKMLSMFREEVRIAPKINWVPAETLPREMKKTSFIKIKGTDT